MSAAGICKSGIAPSSQSLLFRSLFRLKVRATAVAQAMAHTGNRKKQYRCNSEPTRVIVIASYIVLYRQSPDECCHGASRGAYHMAYRYRYPHFFQIAFFTVFPGSHAVASSTKHDKHGLYAHSIAFERSYMRITGTSMVIQHTCS